MTARKDARGLPWAERFKFARHRFYASIGYQRRVRLQLQEVDGYCQIAAPDGSVFRVSPMSWRRYKKGLASRLDKFDRLYLFGALGPPAGPVLDVGAHAGEFSLMALSRGRSVYAVEPDPDALACLRRNLAGREAITVIDALVWNAEEELTFSLAAAKANSSVFGPDAPKKRPALSAAAPRPWTGSPRTTGSTGSPSSNAMPKARSLKCWKEAGNCSGGRRASPSIPAPNARAREHRPLARRCFATPDSRCARASAAGY